MDERECRLMLHDQQSVLAARGAKRMHLVSHKRNESVTIVACANTLGQIIPPAVLFKVPIQIDYHLNQKLL